MRRRRRAARPRLQVAALIGGQRCTLSDRQRGTLSGRRHAFFGCRCQIFRVEADGNACGVQNVAEIRSCSSAERGTSVVLLRARRRTSRLFIVAIVVRGGRSWGVLSRLSPPTLRAATGATGSCALRRLALLPPRADVNANDVIHARRLRFKYLSF